MPSVLLSVFCFVMAAFNLYRVVHTGATANVVYTVVWLVIGIVTTILYFQGKNKSQK